MCRWMGLLFCDCNGVAFLGIVNTVTRIELFWDLEIIKKIIFPKVTKMWAIIHHRTHHEFTIMGWGF